MSARLDVYLTANGYFPSRSKAAEAIAEGRVTRNGEVLRKPSLLIEDGTALTVELPRTRYVSRAGYKLEAAIDGFSLDVRGCTALDVGASTGGFTDCLLQHGAAYVYAVDVGRSQLDERLRRDERVCCRERTNARGLRPADFDRPLDLVTVDVSFLSQRLLYPVVSSLLEPGKPVLTLIKPQFEVGRAHIGKGGIVRDPDGRLFRALEKDLATAAEANGLRLLQTLPSPLTGGDGNREYLAHFRRI